MKISIIGAALAALAFGATADAQGVTAPTIPRTVQLPQLEPLVPNCADPAADRFLEIDITQRPPAGATRVQRLSAWVTADGMFHWPFVMRIRNIGDLPFAGKPGKQSAVVTLDEPSTNTKGKAVATMPFERIAAHSGLAARFEFTMPAAEVEKAKFRRVYTLAIKYDELGEEIVTGRFGDCNLRNNSFAVEFDGSRKSWIAAK